MAKFGAKSEPEGKHSSRGRESAKRVQHGMPLRIVSSTSGREHGRHGDRAARRIVVVGLTPFRKALHQSIAGVLGYFSSPEFGCYIS